MSSHAHAGRMPATRQRSRSRQRKRAVGTRAGFNWERFGRVMLVIVLFAVLASYLNPMINFYHAWQDSKTSKERLIELQAENVALQRQSAEDSTDAVIVREARRLGMVRTGERAFVVRNLPE